MHDDSTPSVCTICHKVLKTRGKTGLCQDCARRRPQMPYPPPNPSGLCQCGCGQMTSRAKASRRRDRSVIGEYVRFIPSHNNRKYPTRYEIDRGTGCWNYQGRKNGHGYGMMTVEGETVVAHRHYYEQALSPIPDGFQLHHTCHNKACCNPDHLVPLSLQDHMNLHRDEAGRLSSK
jgi:hypothetical protein